MSFQLYICQHMKARLLYLSLILTALSVQCAMAQQHPGLKDAVQGKFLMGVAVNSAQIDGHDPEAEALITRHFNSLVAENVMKCEVIHPEEDRYDFAQADRFVDFGQRHHMAIIGHCLIWHSQCAPWFFTDAAGNEVSPEVLKQRMKSHIYTVVGRYRGKIKGWDVVNEAILEDGSFRKSKFYEILGEEYIALAFQYAHEADPDAELYYNDYGMSVPGRRDAVVKLIRTLKNRGLRIDAVGMQGHMGMDYPHVADFETSMLAFAAKGVGVMVTEWDMSALPTVSQSADISTRAEGNVSLNPYPDGLPDNVSRLWNERMKSFFSLFVRHADVLTRVTVWGLTDDCSWKNDFPVRHRRDYPLLFGRDRQPKPFVREILHAAESGEAWPAH